MTTFPFFPPPPPLQGRAHPLQPARMLSFLLLLPLPRACLISCCFNLEASHLPSRRSTRWMASASLASLCCAAQAPRCPWPVPVLLPTRHLRPLRGRGSYKHAGRWNITEGNAVRQGYSVSLCRLDAGTDVSGQRCAGSGAHSMCGGGFWRFPTFALRKTLPAAQRTRWSGSCRAS